MKKDLSKMGIDEAIVTIGAYISITDLIECFDDEKKANEFMENEGNLNEQAILQFIKNNQRYFNMNKFFFINYLVISGKKPIEGYDLTGKVSGRQEKIKMLEEYLEKHPAIIVNTNYTKLQSEVYDSRDYSSLEQRKKHFAEMKKGLERIKRIDSKMEFQSFLMIQILTDLERVYCKVPDLGEGMRSNIIINTHRNDEGMTKEKLVDLLNRRVISGKSFVEYLPHFEEELAKNAEYIDWDKFLILSAYRARSVLERTRHEEYPENNQEILINIMQVALEEIENNKARISGRLELISGELEDVKYSVKDIEKDLKEKVIDGKYYGKAEIDRLRKDLLSGKIKISDIYSKKTLQLMNLNKKQKEECMNQSYENAIDLYRNGFISDEEFKNYLSSTTFEKQAVITIANLKKDEGDQVVTDQELLELYLKGNIELESIKEIERVRKIITETELIRNYKKLKKCTLEEKKKIERYFSIYREVRISGKSSEEKDQIGNDIILELGDDMQEEDFIELYTRNIITLETIIDWNTEEFALQMFKRGLLKPTDSKKLLNSGKVDINQIKAGLLNGLSDEEKISTIITMFDGEESEAIRGELFQTLRISEERPETQNKSTNRTRGNISKPRGNEYELDPCYKFQLLAQIDRDYRSKLTRDGHMIFELPNLNKVIIEKMFKRTKSGISNANGAATYILDLDTLNSEDIVTVEETTNRSKLYELAKQGKVIRSYHTKNWGDAIKEIFDIEHSSRHTEEDKKKIDDIIDKTKRTRKLRTI